ncbi:hypothetical protein CEXT_498531 [Caerostris extrusa]|uniref:Uncharacterized protein n=1 Tax=Caerostris extrusa TaxID=172846 RepID=A0AAV4TIZ6_CAEEX|nr:hypothetical protein CEXT_498531 [Caerostris extrusa]
MSPERVSNGKRFFGGKKKFHKLGAKTLGGAIYTPFLSRAWEWVQGGARIEFEVVARRWADKKQQTTDWRTKISEVIKFSILYTRGGHPK